MHRCTFKKECPKLSRQFDGKSTTMRVMKIAITLSICVVLCYGKIFKTILKVDFTIFRSLTQKNKKIGATPVLYTVGLYSIC